MHNHLLFLLLIFTSNFSLNCYSHPNEKTNDSSNTKIKGLFVFGSSLADNGNNAFLDTLVKPIRFPYGIDFPLGPTGRFSNGKTVIDFFSQFLQFPNFIPPFYDPSTNGTKILHGVDFASGGSGILDRTCANMGKVACLKTQMNNFEKTTLPDLEKQLGMKSEQFLENYMFFVATGANDFQENYFKNPINQTLQVFTTQLQQLLSAHIKNMYKLGGRKFVFMAIYPLGCYPSGRALNGCNETLNNAATFYNAQLEVMLCDLQKQMSGFHYVLINGYDIVTDLVYNLAAHGFKDGEDPCCEVVILATGEKGSPCSNHPNVCPDRDTYVFFDGSHTSQAANKIIASEAFYSKCKSIVYPMNVAELSML